MVQKMRRMTWLFVSLLFFFIGAQAAFGQFTKVTVAIKTPKIGSAIEVITRELEMKKGLEKGKLYADLAKLEVYPLINLDIFLQDVLLKEKRGVGSLRLEDPEGDITVIIPFAYIASIVGKAVDPGSRKLFFWDPKKERWAPIDSFPSEVSGPRKVESPEGGYFYFKVKNWPVDDRIIGCY